MSGIPRPQPDCPDCGGSGVVVTREGERARARACDCLGTCPRCGGRGRVVVELDGALRAGRCACRRIPDRAALLDRAGLPARFADASLRTFTEGANRIGDHEKFAALPQVWAWLQRFRPGEENRGIVLHGRVGRGKTHLLVGIVRELALKHGVTVRFVEFTRLLSTLREQFAEGRSGAPIIAELAEVEVLAIDEIGKGRLTDWELSVIDEIVSRRYNAMRCTIGTTNFSPGAPTGAPPPNLASADAGEQTLGDRVGERTWSRLREMCDFVEVGGCDFRPFAAEGRR